MLNANALAIMIKIQNPNSLMCKFSLNKLTKLLHTNFKTAKQSLQKAVEVGLVEIRTITNKKGETHQDLFVPPFKHEQKQCAILHITKYHNAYLYSESDKKNDAICNNQNAQTFSDIKDLILEIFIASKANSFYKAKNRILSVSTGNYWIYLENICWFIELIWFYWMIWKNFCHFF